MDYQEGYCYTGFPASGKDKRVYTFETPFALVLSFHENWRKNDFGRGGGKGSV